MAASLVLAGGLVACRLLAVSSETVAQSRGAPALLTIETRARPLLRRHVGRDALAPPVWTAAVSDGGSAAAASDAAAA
jgi:hypothetical protein